MDNEVITLTFGESAENHKGMQVIGQTLESGQGFQADDLDAIENAFLERGADTNLYILDSGQSGTDLAYVLIIHKGVDVLLAAHSADHKSLFQEQRALDYDKRAFMYGRVVNKNARWNLCFDEKSQEPDYAAGKGRIVPFEEVPLLSRVRDELAGLHPKLRDMKVESNYYYDANKCGIGWHGDSERKKVLGVRLGTVGVPIYFQWYHNGETVGDRTEIPLEPGDIYLMSEKAAGSDWKYRSRYTLRHAVGKGFNKI